MLLLKAKQKKNIQYNIQFEREIFVQNVITRKNDKPAEAAGSFPGTQTPGDRIPVEVDEFEKLI